MKPLAHRCLAWVRMVTGVIEHVAIWGSTTLESAFMTCLRSHEKASNAANVSHQCHRTVLDNDPPVATWRRVQQAGHRDEVVFIHR
jgi:hypothetical protein